MFEFVFVLIIAEGCLVATKGRIHVQLGAMIAAVKEARAALAAIAANALFKLSAQVVLGNSVAGPGCTA